MFVHLRVMSIKGIYFFFRLFFVLDINISEEESVLLRFYRRKAIGFFQKVFIVQLHKRFMLTLQDKIYFSYKA